MTYEFNNSYLAENALKASELLKQLENLKAKEEVLKKASEGYVIGLLKCDSADIFSQSDKSVLFFDASPKDYVVLPKTKEVSLYAFSHCFEGELLISYRRTIEAYNEAKVCAKERGSKILREWVETHTVEVNE